MSALKLNLPMIRLLVSKDWMLFEKQLAAYVAGGIVALGLLGLATGWSFYLGSLLLIVVVVAAACFAISTSLVAERKEHTLAFVMSLPVSPLDFYLAKLAGNLVTFGVPFVVLVGGCIATILFTSLPDGLVLLCLLVFGHVMLAHAVSLSVAMAVESEGWNTFVMVASMVMINPFIMLLGQIPAIKDRFEGDVVAWSAPALAILGAQVLLSALVLVATGWVHCRKRAFY
jgi:ABC-type transport system involved in multi-copper enzyme maturation permease subunit